MNTMVFYLKNIYNITLTLMNYSRINMKYSKNDNCELIILNFLESVN